MSENTGLGSDRPSRVAIIDDDPLIRESLEVLISSPTVEVRSYSDSSDEALRAIADDPPDLVITDMGLPTRTGLEVVDILKGAASTRDIPIMVVTANTERAIRIEAIARGASDFLIKPFDADEVMLRIGNALRTQRLHLETAATLERLRQVEQMREELTSLIVHDLRAPLGCVRNYLELWLLQAGAASEPKQKGYIEVAYTQTGSVIDQIGALLDVSRLEADAMPLIVRRCPVNEIFARVLATVGAAALKGDVVVTAQHVGFAIRVDADLIVRAVTNMVANAVKHAPPGSDVDLSCTMKPDGHLRIAVRDHGLGVPDALRSRLFTKFGTVTGRGRQRDAIGYGLYMCTLVAQAHHGAVGYEDAEGGGARFWIELPDGEATADGMGARAHSGAAVPEGTPP